jgi:hypothetical protein
MIPSEDIDLTTVLRLELGKEAAAPYIYHKLYMKMARANSILWK